MNLCLASKSFKKVTAELGIREELLPYKKYEFSQYGFKVGFQFIVTNTTPESREISKLKKDFREAQLERDLKKAISVFFKGYSEY
ncbi:MAG: hypothetical protein KI790_13965 [Cyclobacteriaceae bacterium]|nr:hypothetical protein [Cyclobacteriaceae bacterium HetDA_MAG_MS6]